MTFNNELRETEIGESKMDTLHYVQCIAFHGKLEVFRCLSSNEDQGNNHGLQAETEK